MTNEILNPQPEYPTIDLGPGLDVSERPAPVPPAPLRPPIPETEAERGSLSWPGVAWMIVFILYMRKFASKDPAYSWAKRSAEAGGLPRNLTRKSDRKGNVWEVTSTGETIILSKTPRDAELRAAQIVIDSVMGSVARTLREYFAWKRRLPARISEGAEPQSIKEAQEKVETLREELEGMKHRHDQAREILDNAEKIEFHIPVEGLDGMRDYDLPLTAIPVPIYPTKTQPIDWPDLNGDEFEPDRTMILKAVEVGAL